jgi:hypothetical protein
VGRIVARVLPGIAVVAAVASAVYRFRFAGQTFFVDEIWVVEELRKGRFWPGLPQPPLYFFTGVLASRVCGFGEVCLRLPASFFALLLTLVPVAALRWTRGVLDAPAATVWTILLAFSSPIVFYSARVKQYPAEAFGSAVIVAAFLAVVAAPDSRARWRTYFVVCAILVPLLHAMPFMLLGTGVALTVLAWRSSRAHAFRVFGGHAALGVLFAAAYLAYIRPTVATTRRFGDLYGYFGMFPVYFDGTPRFVIDATRHWVGQMLNLTPSFVHTLVLLLVGWVVLLVRSRDATRLAIATACVLPFAAVLVASGFEKYPYGEVRLMIATAPALFLLMALAVQDLARVTPIVPAVFTIVLAVFVVREVRTQPYNASYLDVSDMRGTYAYIRAHHRPGVPVVARHTDAEPLRYYVPSIAGDIVSVEDSARTIALPPAREVWTLLAPSDQPTGAEMLHRENTLLLCRKFGVR